MGKNKDLDHFLTFKNSITLEHIKSYSQNRQKQKKIFERLCSGGIFIQLGNSQIFGKTQFISKNLIIEETIRTGLSLLLKYKSSLKNPKSIATKSFRYVFKIKRNQFFLHLVDLFTLPLTINDRKKLIKFLASFRLFQEEKKDYLDFSNFILLEKIDERYLEIFSTLYTNTISQITHNIASSGISNITITAADTIDFLPSSSNLCLRFESALKKFLSDFIKNSRNRNILKLYFGLTSGKKLSLKEISLKYRISTVRVEKIIRSSLKNLSPKKEKQQNQQLTLDLEIRLKDKIYYELFSLTVILDAIIFKEFGKVYIKINTLKNCTPRISNELFLKILFVYRLLNIPVYKIAKIDTYIFGAVKETGKKIDMLIIRQDDKRLREIIDPDSLKKYISGIKKLFLSSNEINVLSCKINDYFNEISQIREIVYAALKKIDRPAHYSEITKVCSAMFKERVFSSEQIHASLTSKNQQQWTWIGLRGVYALKEWGFIKPDRGLCQTVFEIVNSRFSQTAKPVSINHIYREIGNYRKIVNENSLYFACNFNPRVRVIKKDLFIPVLKNQDTMIKDSNFTEDISYGTSYKPLKKDLKFLGDLDKKLRRNSIK